MPPAPTSRQIEVLSAHVACGSNKGAGWALGISPSTVRNHLVCLRVRLGVETNEQAVYVLTSRGVLLLPGVGRRVA